MYEVYQIPRQPDGSWAVCWFVEKSGKVIVYFLCKKKSKFTWSPMIADGLKFPTIHRAMDAFRSILK